MQLKLHTHVHYNNFRHNPKEPILNKSSGRVSTSPEHHQDQQLQTSFLVDALTIHDCVRGDGEWVAGLSRTRESHRLGIPAAAYIAPEKIRSDQRSAPENHDTKP